MDGPSGAGVMAYLGESHDVLEHGWNPLRRTQLFRYNCHYFGWAWGLASAPTVDRARSDFQRLWESWRADTLPGRLDAWSPYVVSIRAWSLCGTFETLVADSPIEQDVLMHLRASLGFLLKNKELDVGGNHLVKNLKAIIGLGAFFGLRSIIEANERSLAAEVQRQVLADGGHFEMSPAYHLQVEGDLLDVIELLRAYGLPVDPRISRATAAMADWRTALTYPDKTIPLIGDSAPPPLGLIQELERRNPGRRPSERTILRDSGFVVARPRPQLMIVIDLGRPCPSDLPAHAQADFGTFEVWHNGRTVIDPGTSTYVGSRRQYERSTVAHNTLSVADVDQTEVWGSFRAGRRARVTPILSQEEPTGWRVEASVHYRIGIHRIHHSRQITVKSEEMIIRDTCRCPRDLSVESGITLANSPPSTGPIHLSSNSTISTEPTTVAAAFGQLVVASRYLINRIGPGVLEFTIGYPND
ncbi:MAG: hypothetical protein GY724_30170 [Actinomycetia bacterium]|nr:hypothetical protein [Actinomycetes bacterium]